jgi:hypothetical protein
MITIRALLPTNEDVKTLRGIGPPLHVYRSNFQSSENTPLLQKVLASHAALFLRGDNHDYDLRLTVQYKDVVFKFEVFNLVFDTAVAVPSDLREIATIEDWNQIDCVLAFEWLRPAVEGEVPSSWEKIVHRRGPRGEISDAATAIGVSMVGIVFRNSITNSPVSMLYTDGDDPCSLLISRDVHEIRQFTSDCELVTIDDFPKWKRDLKKWSASLGADQRPFVPSS